jgi:hypothetical protein
MIHMHGILLHLLPEQDITGAIHDKAIRFQCRNKSDIDPEDMDSEIAQALNAARARKRDPEVTDRRGDVIQTPPPA